MVECIKIFIWTRVLINGNGWHGWQFFLRIGATPLPPCNKLTQSNIKKMQITSLKICLSMFNFFQVSFSPLLLWILTENRIKLKKIHYLNYRLKWNTSLQICKLQLIFINTCIKGPFQMKGKQNAHQNSSIMAEEIVSVITQEYKEIKLWIHPNLRQPNSSFTYSFKFT